nr:MAG TPA: hypothetical protein [Caudoviricetes sp.]DAH48296.1 MAG TPA: hypothetical protein [Bacteriophage sp.]
MIKGENSLSVNSPPHQRKDAAVLERCSPPEGAF